MKTIINFLVSYRQNKNVHQEFNHQKKVMLMDGY